MELHSENSQTLVKCVCVSTPFLQLTMSWINEVEMARSTDDLVTSQSVEGRSDVPDFEMLDARIASALRKIIINTSFKRRVSVEEQRAQKHNRHLRGRQIAYMIYDHFQATGAYDAAQGLSDLFKYSQDFDRRWEILLGRFIQNEVAGFRTISNCGGYVQPRIDSR